MEQGFHSVLPGLPVQGTFFAAAARNPGQGIHVVQPVNSRKPREVVPPPEPSSQQPWNAELYIPGYLSSVMSL
eukprot:18259-Chlamydomonas_euryale.AAC.1